MTAKPPEARVPHDGKRDDDENGGDASIRLVDALFEDVARAAAANPGPPSDAARALSRMARSGLAEERLGGGGGVVEALGSTDGTELDTDRIRAMDRAQLVAAIDELRALPGKVRVDLGSDATDDQLRGVVRALRPRGRP